MKAKSLERETNSDEVGKVARLTMGMPGLLHHTRPEGKRSKENKKNEISGETKVCGDEMVDS